MKEARKSGGTFAGQEQLQKLPIPPLKDSLAKYVAALEPLQTAHEHEDTLAAVKEFEENEGPLLQQRLTEYAADKSSYIEQFWYDSYLNFDNPVVLNLNPFFLLEDDPTPARNNQVDRAASLTISSLSFVRALRKEELTPDAFRNQPLCMYQYSRIFGTSRIPTENGCVMSTDRTARHIVVLCRSQFYWFDVLDSNHDIIMTEKDLALNFRAIVQDAEQTPISEAAKSAMGVLSTENRRTWAGLREVLTKDDSAGGNKECLSIVDTALFLVCLDDAIPESVNDICMNMLCGTNKVEKAVQIGTCTNRWYDKLQIIVCKNGSAGINFEHTGVDGHTILRYASDVYTDTILRFAKSINGGAPSIWPTTSPDPSKRDPASFGDVSTTPHRLEWKLNPEISLAVRFAEARLADLIQQNEFQVLEFAGYGKSFITSQGFSPDAFVQMAFQAAYYGLYGRVECTYEPAMTKVFLHGRTEAVRSVTMESVEFVRRFWDDVAPASKVEALRKACDKHVAITKECAKGLGQDRHLYSLFCIWRRLVEEESNGSQSSMENGTGVNSGDAASDNSSAHGARHRLRHDLPSLFTDGGWEKLNSTVLSTSNCGNPALRQFGFGPTSGDGFGIGYIIKDDMLSFCVSSKHRQTRRFLDTLQAYLVDLRTILRQTQRKKTFSGTRARSSERLNDLQTRPESKTRSGRMVPTLTTSSSDETDSDLELTGGYGYFDVGTMDALIRAQKPDHKGSRLAEKRVAIGRRLRLNEY